MGGGEPDPRAGASQPGSARRGRRGATLANTLRRGRPAEGGRPQAARWLLAAGRTEAPSSRPPRKRRREMPTSGKPAAECGGGDTEWKAKWRRRRWTGAEGRARSPRPPRRAALARGSSPASLPALSHQGYLGSLGRAPATWPPALGPVAAVQEPRCPLQVGLGLAWRVGRTLSSRARARVGGAVAAGAHAQPRWRGSRACCGRAGRAESARCGPDLAGCMDLS